MPIRWFDASRDDSVGMAVQQLLTVGGITDVTMRAVARTARMSLGTLGNHYGSKEQMLMGAARAIGTLYVDDLITRAAWDDTLAQVLAGYVPRDAEELLELKVWQDLVTVGRSSRGMGRSWPRSRRGIAPSSDARWSATAAPSGPRPTSRPSGRCCKASAPS